jgi:AcrR family transcriptional regulator
VNNVNIPRRQTYHHGNLRPALIKAGLRALAEHGPDGFTLRDVARRAGVTPPAVYRHFEDKDQLLAAVAGECVELMLDSGEAAVAEASDNALARFRHAGIAYVQFAVSHPEHFRVLSLPDVRDRLPPETRARLEAGKQAQHDDLAAGQAAGVIADIPIDELLLAAQATVHGLAHMIVEGELGKVTPERATDLAIAATGALGIGFIPRTPPPPDPMRPRARVRGKR